MVHFGFTQGSRRYLANAVLKLDSWLTRHSTIFHHVYLFLPVYFWLTLQETIIAITPPMVSFNPEGLDCHFNFRTMAQVSASTTDDAKAILDKVLSCLVFGSFAFWDLCQDDSDALQAAAL